MDEKSNERTLLLPRNENLKQQSPNLLTLSIKWIVKAAIWLIFIAWVALLLVYPSATTRKIYLNLLAVMNTSVFGDSGSVFLLYSGPLLLIAILATAYIYLRDLNGIEEMTSWKQPPRLRLWTMPILVDGPFGVVSAAEVIGIVVFMMYIMWSIYAQILQTMDFLSYFKMPFENRLLMIELTGHRLGEIGLFCIALLFIPITRGSLLLRLIDIPFEHATRYHVWLGHFTMLLFTLHGLFYAIPWAIQGLFVELMVEWTNKDVANLPGVISLTAGLLMWVTSLPGIRRVNFELFFYTHQLYVVFVVFMALHIGKLNFCFVGGAIFLFMLDRFLRFFQSRRKVDVISARCFPCGTLELILSKPSYLSYNALGWIFLQIRELSWLQWHPFSVSTSPLDGKHHLAVLIKVLGDWTQKLETYISENDLHNLTASVEGPYGHESAYHLTYENLILVAGGIGISPFLAILSDILHRINEGKSCLPKNVLIIWAIKQSDELPLLQTVGMESICQNFSQSLNLKIQTYVTRQSQPSLEEGKPSIERVNPGCIFSASKGCGMSVLVGTGNILWSGMYVTAATVGLVVTVALVNAQYINAYKVDCSWYEGLLLVVSMVVSVVVFGGSVIILWSLWERKSLADDDRDENKQEEVQVQNSKGKGDDVNTIRYGERPDFRGIFGSMGERWGHVDIGVIVCGPPTLQTSVAKECRNQNLGRPSNGPVFHFNSHSFDL